MRVYKFLLQTLIIWVFSIQNIQASHIAGAQIYYKSIGKYKYEVYVDLYRDCMGAPISKPIIILKSVSSGDTMLINSYALQSITAVSPYCISYGKSCNPQNKTNNNLGFEKHSYKTTIDLTNWYNKGACQVLIGTGLCCRSGAITTGAESENFWAYSMVDLCKWYKNSSPVLYAETQTILGCNVPVYYNFAAADFIDDDSLVYEMVDPMKDWTNKTTWGSGFNAQNPFTLYWPSGYNKSKGPDPLANPPIGFFLSRITGEMVFSPSDCSEVGPAAVRISEYHKDSATGKYVLVGYVTRDFYALVKTTSANPIPQIKGPDKLYLADSTFSKVIYTTSDEVFRYYPLPNDSSKLKLLLPPLQSLSTAFHIIDSNVKNQGGIFRWKPMGMQRTRPYLMVLEARDNGCDLNSIVHKTVNIYVKKKSELAWVEGIAFMDINKNCRRDSMEYILPGAMVSADGGKTTAFVTDSSGYFGGWLPVDTFNFKIIGKNISFQCTKGLKTAANKSFTLNLGCIGGMQIYGYIYGDTLNNCRADSIEPRYKGQFVYTVPGNYTAITNKDGFWYVNVPASHYKVFFAPRHPYTKVKCPVKPREANFYSSSSIGSQNFAIYDTSNITDVSASLISSSNYRRGFTSYATLVVKNNGNTKSSSNSVWIRYNKKLKYVSSSSYLVKTDSTLKFAVSSLKPDEELRFTIVFKADTATCKLNDTMSNVVWLDTSGLSNDFVKTNNYDRNAIKIVAAVDPNIKQEQNTNGYAWKGGNKLKYFVQFQNTGTDTAVNITVIDTLHYNLSGRTLVFNGASHPYDYILDGHILKVTFSNINLVDTSVSKERSIGHFEFSIEIDTTLNQEIKFYNRADIYFDFAKPVKTNKSYITYTSLIKTGPTDRTNYCGNDTISVKYNSKFSFESGNIFKLYLSDSNGVFSSVHKAIDSISSTATSGSFSVTIPSGTPVGKHYKLKVESNKPYGPIMQSGFSNEFSIDGTISKPAFINLSKLYCGKDSIGLSISSNAKKIQVYDDSNLIYKGANLNPKIKLSVGKHLLSIKAFSGTCIANSDTILVYSDTLPITKLSSPSHSNYSVCGNDSITLEVDGGFTSFLLLGNGLNFLDSIKSSIGKTVAPNNNDKRTARVTSIYGCQNNSNTLTFTNIKKPTFTFTDSDSDDKICLGESVQFTVGGKSSLKFQMLKNGKMWLNPFKTSLTTKDIANLDRISVLCTDTVSGCSDTSLQVKFDVVSFEVKLKSKDSSFVICDNVNVTLNMSGASSYALYKNGTFWTAPKDSSITLFGIKNNDEIYAQGTFRGCKNISNKLKYKVNTPFISLKINNACIGDSLRLDFSGGVKYNLFKNSSFYKTINRQSFVSNDFKDFDKIYLEGIDSIGCSNYSTTQTLVFNTLPSIGMSNPDIDLTTCSGDLVTFNFNGGTIYDLYRNGKYWQKITGNTFNFTDAKNNDSYYVKGYLNSCGNFSNTIKLSVVDAPNVLFSTLDSNNSICDNEKVSLVFSGALRYDLYKNGNLFKLNISSPYDLSNLNNLDSFFLNGIGNYSCPSNSNKIVFKVFGLPNVVIKNLDTDNTICVGEDVKLVLSGTQTYKLFKNGVFIQDVSKDSLKIGSLIDKDEIYAIGTSNEGCIDTSNQIKFKVIDIPSKPVISKIGSFLSSNYTSGNQWYEGKNIITGATSKNYLPTKTSDYFVSYTDINGCASELSDAYKYSLGVLKNGIKGFKVYPNPMHDYITIELDAPGKYLVQLFDMEGKLVKETTFYGNNLEWNIKPSKGLYRLRLESEMGLVGNLSLEVL